MDAEQEFERIKEKYKKYKDFLETLNDIDFLINTLDVMNKRAKMNKNIKED